jgi:GTP-binding protein
LGVVALDEFGADTFVMADIPGLIEGAHEGHGLGTTFLRHVERTRVLLHLIDVSEFNEKRPVECYEIIRHELGSFSDLLIEKPEIVVATKLDSAQDPTRLAELEEFCREHELPFYAISAATGQGLKALTQAASTLLREVKPNDAPKLPRVKPPDNLSDILGPNHED